MAPNDITDMLARWYGRLSSFVDHRDGNFLTRLGDLVGTRQMSVRNSNDQQVFGVNSLGLLDSPQLNSAGPLAAGLSFAQRDENGVALINQYGAIAKTTADVNHTSTGNWVAVPFNDVIYMLGSSWSSGQASRLYAPVTDIYDCSACLKFASNATGVRGVAFRMNGGTYRGSLLNTAVNGFDHDLNIYRALYLEAGQYIELMGFQSSGGTLAMKYQNAFTVECSMLARGLAVSRSRVMPLGDSITVGYGNPPAMIAGGYRSPLYTASLANGRYIEFVGTQTDNSVGMRFTGHEGYSGYRVDQIATVVTGLSASLAPKLILLDIGTNDIYQQYQMPGLPNRYSALITQLATKWPQAKILITTIGPFSGSYASMMTDQPAFNSFIKGLPKNHPYGARLVVVDMAAVLNAGLQSDGLHPNSTGYNTMATTWWNAIGPMC